MEIFMVHEKINDLLKFDGIILFPRIVYRFKISFSCFSFLFSPLLFLADYSLLLLSSYLERDAVNFLMMETNQILKQV